MPTAQVTRYCTHMFQLARRRGFCRTVQPSHELVQGYFDHLEHSGYAIGDRFFLSRIEGNDVLVVQQAWSAWVDVVTRKKRTKDDEICTGDIERYGYYAPGNRWSYGYAPFHPMQIKAFIRALPPIPHDIQPQSELDSDFPLNDFVALDASTGYIDDRLVASVFEHLRELSDVDRIMAALEKMHEFENVPKGTLATEWYEHGRNLFVQGDHAFRHFFDMATTIDPNLAINIESDLALVTESYSRRTEQGNGIRPVAQTLGIENRKKRERLAKHNKALIAIDLEERKFKGVKETRRKRKADELLKAECPEWYSQEAGHSFLGYLYADFVRELLPFKKLGRLSETDAAVVDYFASLAILDDTISDRTMATMHRIKGHLALARNETIKALGFFRQALAYDPHIGVKKLVRKLELEMEK